MHDRLKAIRNIIDRYEHDTQSNGTPELRQAVALLNELITESEQFSNTNFTNFTSFAENIEHYAKFAHRALTSAGSGERIGIAEDYLLALINHCAGKTDPELVPLSEAQQRLAEVCKHTQAVWRALDSHSKHGDDIQTAREYLGSILDLCDPNCEPDTPTAE